MNTSFYLLESDSCINRQSRHHYWHLRKLHPINGACDANSTIVFCGVFAKSEDFEFHKMQYRPNNESSASLRSNIVVLIDYESVYCFVNADV